MVSIKKQTIHNIGSSSEELQTAYETVMAFNPSSLGEIILNSELLEQFSEREALMDPLLADGQGFTPGIKSLLRQANSAALVRWQNLRNPFDAAIQPFMEKIGAVKEFPNNKKAIEQKAQEQEDSILKQADSDPSYRRRKLEKEVADKHYDNLVQGEGGRPVNLFAHTWLYVLILLSITSIEWLINYDSFFNWTRVPAMAAGFTICMAIAVAVSAHVHGEYLKQKNTRFGPASVHITRAIVILSLMTLALIIAVIVAGYARYNTALQSIATQPGFTIPIPGEKSASENNPLIEVYFSLGINLIVWLVGLTVSFMSHDENDEIMSAGREKWWRNWRFERVHKPWVKRITTIHAQGEIDINRLRKATELSKTSTEDQRNKLEQVDQREKALYKFLANQNQVSIDRYRMILGKNLQDKGHTIQVGEETLSGKDYQKMAVNLDCDSLRKLIFPS